MLPGGWSRLMLAFLTPGPTVDGRRVDGSMARMRAEPPHYSVKNSPSEKPDSLADDGGQTRAALSAGLVWGRKRPDVAPL